MPCCSSRSDSAAGEADIGDTHATAASSRRGLLGAAALTTCSASLLGDAAALAVAPPPDAPPRVTLPSGLIIEDVRPGQGPTPSPGDIVSVHWSGYTKGYQGKRIDNTSLRDEPYDFVLGSGQAIAAFDEAVSTMHIGGIRRIEVPGARPELGYSLDRSQRFTNEMLSSDGKIYKYRRGPQPAELGGQRALDFVLDNTTLRDFNRDLLFDIKLLAVYKRGGAKAAAAGN